MQINFSIIIPIHKPNYDYLIECINSINPQLHNNDEVICVLNGNSINDNAIVKEFLPKNYVVVNIDEGNVSVARNKGIEIAKNNYIVFVDCDDIIGNIFLDKSRTIISNINPDYITYLDSTNQNDLNKDYNNCQPIEKSLFLKIWQLSNNNTLPSFQYRSCWNHIYKKELIIKNNITFNENQTIAEDTLFNLEYTLNSNSFVIDNSIMYFYRLNNKGCSIRFNNNAFNTINVVITNYKNILDEHNMTKPYYNHLYKEILFNYLPYIFRSFLFHKNNKLSLREKRMLIKDFCQKEIVAEASANTKLKNVANKKHRIFLMMLKRKMYGLICLTYRKQ